LFTSGGLGLVILVLVLRIWSCLHNWYLPSPRANLLYRKGTHPPSKHIFECIERTTKIFRVSIALKEQKENEKARDGTTSSISLVTATSICSGHRILHTGSDAGRNQTGQISEGKSVQDFGAPGKRILFRWLWHRSYNSVGANVRHCDLDVWFFDPVAQYLSLNVTESSTGWAKINWTIFESR